MKIGIWKYAVVSMLGLIILIGLCLRLYALGGQSLWIDEIYTINGAYAVVDHGYPLLDSGHWYTNNFFSVYITAFLLKLGSWYDAFDPWLLRLPAALFGTALIGAVYLLARQLYPNRLNVALLSAFLIAFSYNEIAWSRQVRGYAAAALLIVLATYLYHLYLGSEKDGDKNVKLLLGMAVISYIFAISAHWSSLAYLPVIVVMLLLKKRVDIFYSERSTAISLLVAIGISALTILLYLRFNVFVWRYLGFPFVPFFVILVSFVASKSADFIRTDQVKLVRIILPFMFVVVVGNHFLNFYPIQDYKLQLSGPQKEYTETFSIIKNEMNDSDIIISPHSVLTRVYLNQDGLWFPKGRVYEKGLDFYTGVPMIDGTEQLRNVIEANHGFLILEGVDIYSSVLNSLTNSIEYIKSNPNIRLIYSSGHELGTMIWLFKF